MAFHEIKIGSDTFTLAPQNVKPTSTEVSASRPIPFLSDLGSTDGLTERTIYTDTTNSLHYNPSTNVLTVPTVSGNLSGTATNATYINVEAASTTDASYYIQFVNGTSGNRKSYTDTILYYNPSTNTLTTTNFNGTAKNATYINVAAASNFADTSYYIQFVNGTSGNRKSYIDVNLLYNPKKNVLGVGQVNGKLYGPVQTTATSTDASYYISFVNDSGTGMRYSYVDSGLYYNPSTNTLTAAKIKYTSTAQQWIGGKTLTNNAFYPSNSFTTNAFFPILAAKTSGENVITLGGLGDQYGFFGYKKDTTDNKTDWHFKWDSNNGNTYVTGKIYGTATHADNINVAMARITDATYYVSFVNGTSGARIPYTDAALYYNPSSNILTVGNVKITGTNSSTATIKSDAATNMYVDIGGNIPLVIKYDSTDKFIACGSSFSNLVNLGTSARKWANVYATAFNGNLNGNATTASAASNVRVTDTEPTSVKDYYPTFVTGFASGTNYSVRANDGLKYYTFEGSTKVKGSACIGVGNDIAEGTAGNKEGAIRIYGPKTAYGDIKGPDGSGGVVCYLPNTGGTFVTHATRGSAAGGTAKPVYIASNGRATPCSSTVGSASRPVYMNAGTITSCTWGTSMTSATNYYLMGASSSTAGLVYNTNVKVYSNAIYASSGFYESSDERLKDFQEDIEVNFSYLHNIPKKYYSWKADSAYTRHIGTSAQEVQKYYPELVNTDETGYLTMNYDKLSVVALKAIDVLHEEVTELKKENAELKERLARLEELILNK